MRGIVLILMIGCAPKVNVEVLEPAAKTLPDHIKKVATLQREVGSDRLEKGAAIEAEQALLAVVSRSPRFEVVAITQDQASQFNALERTLDWSVVDAITGRVGAQAVIALESVDSTTGVSEDSSKETYTDDKGKDHITLTWTATRTTAVDTAWKVYDADNDNVVDAFTASASASWTAQATTAKEARAGLPGDDEGILELAYEAGEDYGRRIAPSWVKVSRVYYPSGSDRMAKAKVAIEAGKLEEAAQLWEREARGSDGKLSAKAHFNLAVAWEGRGNLRKAIDQVVLADAVLSNSKTRSYLALLKERKKAKQTLKGQMAPVRGDEP